MSALTKTLASRTTFISALVAFVVGCLLRFQHELHHFFRVRIAGGRAHLLDQAKKPLAVGLPTLIDVKRYNNRCRFAVAENDIAVIPVLNLVHHIANRVAHLCNRHLLFHELHASVLLQFVLKLHLCQFVLFITCVPFGKRT